MSKCGQRIEVLINLKNVNVNVLAKLQIVKDCCLNYVAGILIAAVIEDLRRHWKPVILGTYMQSPWPLRQHGHGHLRLVLKFHDAFRLIK